VPVSIFKNFSLLSEMKRNWIHIVCVSLVHFKIQVYFLASFRFFLLRFFLFASTKTIHFPFEYFVSLQKLIFSHYFISNERSTRRCSDYSTIDSYTLIHVFKPTHSHIYTQAYRAGGTKRCRLSLLPTRL
jgi:hypothetical protein